MHHDLLCVSYFPLCVELLLAVFIRVAVKPFPRNQQGWVENESSFS